MEKSFGYAQLGNYWAVKLNVKLSEKEATELARQWFPDITMCKHGDMYRLEGAVYGHTGLYEFKSDLKVAKLRTEIAAKQEQLYAVQYDMAQYEDHGIEQLGDNQLT